MEAAPAWKRGAEFSRGGGETQHASQRAAATAPPPPLNTCIPPSLALARSLARKHTLALPPLPRRVCRVGRVLDCERVRSSREFGEGCWGKGARIDPPPPCKLSDVCHCQAVARASPSARPPTARHGWNLPRRRGCEDKAPPEGARESAGHEGAGRLAGWLNWPVFAQIVCSKSTLVDLCSHSSCNLHLAPLPLSWIHTTISLDHANKVIQQLARLTCTRNHCPLRHCNIPDHVLQYCISDP